MTDPFPPKDQTYSMEIPEKKVPVVYKNFKDLDWEKKIDVLSDEIVHRDVDEPIELMLKRIGVKWDIYKRISADVEYQKMVADKAFRENIVPYIPLVYETMSKGAIKGDPAKMRLFLEKNKDILPIAATLVNQNIVNMTNDELQLAAEKLARKLGGKEED